MIYTCTQLAIGVLEALTFYIILNSVMKRRDTLPAWAYFFGTLMLATIIDASFYIYYGSIINTLIMYLSVFAFSLMFSGDIKSKILFPLIGLTLNACCELTVLYFLAFLLGATTHDLVYDKTLWTIGAILSKMSFLIIANFIRIRYNNQKLFLKTSYWILMLVVFAPAITTAFVIFKLMYSVSGTVLYNLSFVSCASLIASAFVSLYLYEHISDKSELINREQQYEQQIKSQAKHLNEILLVQNQLKGFRHDIKNHWIAIYGYFSNGDYEGGKKYIEQISGSLTDTNATDTGNIALDAIISTKKAMAEKKGISCNVHIQIPEQISLDAVDICIIFGNSLDNAIEACEKVKSGDKYINLSVIYEGNSVLCKITNSVETKNKITLKTTKSDKRNHGLGLDNIKQALSKYNHVLKIDHTANEFVLSFVIFNC